MNLQEAEAHLAKIQDRQDLCYLSSRIDDDEVPRQKMMMDGYFTSLDLEAALTVLRLAEQQEQSRSEGKP